MIPPKAITPDNIFDTANPLTNVKRRIGVTSVEKSITNINRNDYLYDPIN